MGEPELSLINFPLNSFVKDIFHDTVEKRCSFTAAIYLKVELCTIISKHFKNFLELN
ncbi:hypothetical protein PPOLYM_03878 [Paenibacillus polymyxa]|jgi:hypothetical protein|nr:hypothetical protein SAMN04488603_103269 [Paenibacillus sp. cl130]VUG07469.1 hypothetical protein PPOLYM_03878 [Paenibacillus polymyxa]